MKNLLKFITFSILLVIFTGCNGQVKLTKSEIEREYFTQQNMWASKKSKYSTSQDKDALISKYSVFSVNYLEDKFIPINTSVEIVKVEHNTIFFKLDNEIYAYIRTRQSRGQNLTKLFYRTFSTLGKDLSKYNKIAKKNIQNAVLKQGMTKNEVILSRGYPPEYRTQSLENSTWYYWDKRKNKITLNFNEKKLISINKN
ncbi:MAG: hypothetical protein DRG78_08010 [Epsilonproteobacteria bacterium]|nr:MAG: hypothetical protein DRG78_08010 [Campylobacterota bacterium]